MKLIISYAMNVVLMITVIYLKIKYSGKFLDYLGERVTFFRDPKEINPDIVFCKSDCYPPRETSFGHLACPAGKYRFYPKQDDKYGLDDHELFIILVKIRRLNKVKTRSRRRRNFGGYQPDRNINIDLSKPPQGGSGVVESNKQIGRGE